MSRRRAASTGAKPRCMTTETPPILGLVLAGGLARRMGGGDKARIRIGGQTILADDTNLIDVWWLLNPKRLIDLPS